MERTEYDEVLAEINAADRAISEALDARADAVRRALTMRQESTEQFLPEPKDAETYARALERAGDRGFAPSGIRAVFREVLSASHALEEKRKVVYFGDAGGFAHQASRFYFGRSASFQASTSVATALGELGRGLASYAVLPLETSEEGTATATLLGLVDSDVHICGEVTIANTLHLWSAGKRSDVSRIVGTQEALQGCVDYLRREFPNAEREVVPSAAAAIELAAEGHGVAALGPQHLEEMAGERVGRIDEAIEDARGAFTRYAIVGTKLPSRTGRDRTVIAMAVNDAPGALYASLQPFAERGINLTRLESRPLHGTGPRYMFFVEMDGHVTDRPILTGLESLRAISQQVRIVGSYPQPE